MSDNEEEGSSHHPFPLHTHVDDDDEEDADDEEWVPRSEGDAD
eukprot:CAMPEP_0113914032 /NCGR_PEP_ID=MMETSP0780_2-20120614/30030_1 /TAXON_ID=652834 /ORGANISM="Palpitomonas bilix" /LENGTH=42 /DNA_ID=CAMNT_0000911603 /DNA_START=43 /DNA_END=168 /DNA_ORIENTATION=- /assembly_acc=CAM_ASM_000599